MTTTTRRSREARAEAGRKSRQRIPRSSHGEWTPPVDRPDPVSLLTAQETTRVAELVPLRHERMAISAFAFYRGAACIFASDLSTAPDTGMRVQLCGDAHLANFGVFASPERSLVFDLNDFDETLPGSFDLDLKRLAASFEVATRANNLSASQRRKVVDRLVTAYCQTMRTFAATGQLDTWYSRLTADDIATYFGDMASKDTLERFWRMVRKVQGKDRLKAFDKLTVADGDGWRFLSDPPLLVPVGEVFGEERRDQVVAEVRRAFSGYRRSLQPDRRALLDRYHFVDLARKVVGVGSVGTRCWVALMIGDDGHDPLFLQVKEAEASVLEPYVGASEFAHHGRRVVHGQRLTQSTPDILLGWGSVTGVDGTGRDYYFRQLWDWKGSAALEEYEFDKFMVYAVLCGYSLARAHARSGDAIALSAYLGGGKSMSAALVEFAASYADQNEADHRRFTEWLTTAQA